MSGNTVTMVIDKGFHCDVGENTGGRGEGEREDGRERGRVSFK